MKKTERGSEGTIKELMIPSQANLILGFLDMVADVIATERLVSLSLSICHLVLAHVAPAGLGICRPCGARNMSPLWGYGHFAPTGL
jgi:hypothetical protein